MAEAGLRELLVEKVENFFNEDSWNYEYDEKYSVFTAGITLKSKLKNTKMMVVCKNNGITFRFPLSIGTDEESELQVMEYITRANCGLNYGCFWMNLDENRVEFVTFLPCEDVPTFNAIKQAIMLGLYMLDRYGDELLAVIFGMKNAKDAVEAAERRED